MKHAASSFMLGLAVLLGWPGEGRAEESKPAEAAPLAPEVQALDENGRPTDRVDIGALPLLNYDSDYGVGGGLNVALFSRKAGYAPYQYSLRMQGFASSGGIQNHYVQLDAPRFMGSDIRLTASVGYSRDLTRPHYGFGNNVPLLQPSDPTCVADPVCAARWESHYYNYDFYGFDGWLRLRKRLGNQWELSVIYNFTTQLVNNYAGSFLQEQGWTGSGRGNVGLLEVGFNYDRRDSEASTTRGIWASATVRGGAPLVGSSFTFWGGTATMRAYHSFFAAPYLVLAGRISGVGMWGDVPISKLPALGGGTSIRGLPRMRYEGNLTLSANAEVRSRVARFRPFGHILDLWAVAFADAGRLWADGVDNGAPGLLHMGYGGGLRVAWEEDYVVRVDMGFSEGTRGIYIDFGQLF